MKAPLTFLETLWLLLGTGVIGHEILITQTLSGTELALGLFFYGLLASSVADREGTRGPVDLLRVLSEILGGRRNP